MSATDTAKPLAAPSTNTNVVHRFGGTGAACGAPTNGASRVATEPAEVTCPACRVEA